MMTRLSRRQVLELAIPLLVTAHRTTGQAATLCAGGTQLPVPDAKTFAAGDFLWPKLPGVIVPYNSRPGEAQPRDQKQWEDERSAFLRSLNSTERTRYAGVASLSYDQFVRRYLAGEDPTRPTTVAPAGTVVYVGHVAMIDMRNGQPVVIEAMIGQGVREISYPDWLKERSRELIWHGRLTGRNPQAIPDFARRQVGKPYDFWNFNLADDSRFYCSKLAWYCVSKATGLFLDDDSNSARSFWFSPKQAMNSPHICLLNSPGDYFNR
jgi:hypothetical protein